MADSSRPRAVNLVNCNKSNLRSQCSISRSLKGSVNTKGDRRYVDFLYMAVVVEPHSSVL